MLNKIIYYKKKQSKQFERFEFQPARSKSSRSAASFTCASNSSSRAELLTIKLVDSLESIYINKVIYKTLYIIR